MEKKGIEKKLIEKVREKYKVMYSRIGIKEEKSEIIETEKGVRQGCPLSPTLFNIVFADLEEEMKKGQEGGLVIEKKESIHN